MAWLQEPFRIALIGIGATALMDLWLLFLRPWGVAFPNFAFVGRWVGHLSRGQLAHAAIGKARPIPGEMAWGWATHYAVGMAFATLLVMVQGTSWMTRPTPWPAVVFGVVTVLMPLLVMQPAMGMGFASSRTPTPLKNCLRSLVNHTVFGLGLYLSARLIAVFFPTA